MKAMLLIFNDEKAWAALTPAQLEAQYGAYNAFTQALIGAGALVEASQLQPSSTAKSVVVREAGARVSDGPYVDTKEQVGGYFLIQVKDMAEALDWAAKCPGSHHGGVEVRPIVERG